MFHTSIDLSTSVLIGSVALTIAIPTTAVSVSYYLGKVSNKLDGLQAVNQLTTQIDTFTSTFDAAAAGRAPQNIEDITEDMNDIANSLGTLEDVDESVNTIEAAITAVDLPGIQEAIERIFTDTFSDDSLPIGNSAHHELEESGVEVAISLAGYGEQGIQINVRFGREVAIGSLSEQLAEDEDLGELEEELFGSQAQILAPSPRQLNFDVLSTDMDVISTWIEEMIKRLDEYVVQTTTTEEEFDEIVGSRLKESGYR